MCVVHHTILPDSFWIRIARFQPKQDSDQISFIKNRIGSDSKNPSSDHRCCTEHYQGKWHGYITLKAEKSCCTQESCCTHFATNVTVECWFEHAVKKVDDEGIVSSFVKFPTRIGNHLVISEYVLVLLQWGKTVNRETKHIIAATMSHNNDLCASVYATSMLMHGYNCSGKTHKNHASLVSLQD